MVLATPTISERLKGIDETHYGICLQCDKDNYLGKKLLLSRELDGMLYEMDKQDLYVKKNS